VRTAGRTVSLRLTLIAAAEAGGAVALATVGVALLEDVAPVTGLGVLYMLAVLFVAIRRGQLPALLTALASVLVLNYFFIEPRHQFTIASSQNAVALVVFLIAAVVVGRLAAASRERAAEAEERARQAAARQHEADLLASAASAVLEGEDLEAQLVAVGESLAAATGASGASGARLELSAAPTSADGEVAIRLPTATRPGWLYAVPAEAWQRDDLERLAKPLARLVDVAVARTLALDRIADAEAARRADVAKTAVLHAISHDLRSPLTAITTAAGGLAASGLSPSDRADLVSVLESESARLARLVEDLLDLSRIQAGAANPQPDWCDLHDAVASAAAQVRLEHGEHRIDFALPADLPLVQADSAQLERVFANLLENAVHFSPPDAPVRISGGVAGDRVTVRVTDRGRGIAAVHRARVFEPFFRGRESKGSGLGLAICRGFVEANGGRILLQAGTSDGTSFSVSFPLVPQPVAAS